MRDSVIRCDNCDCIIENISFNYKKEDLCKDCYMTQFKEIFKTAYENLIDEIEDNDIKSKKEIIDFIKNKIKKNDY